MKPNFALSLSNEGVELLYRDSGGWMRLGSVNFDADDVQAGCAALLAEAEKREPGNVRTKLVLPESQLRYSTVLAPGPTDEARRYQIEAEIEALTPYAIDELVYDFSVEDDHALIVICAKDTLSEAEHFAEDAGFNPVAFVAAPEQGLFGGEPNFGETSVARAYLGGDRVQFDAEPVRASGKAGPVPAPPPAAAQTSTQAPPPRATLAAAQPVDTATAKVSGTPPVKPAAASRAAATPAPARAATVTPPASPTGSAAPKPAKPAAPAEPLAKVGNLVRRMGTRLRREQARSDRDDKAVAASAPKAPVSPVPTPPAAVRSVPVAPTSAAPRPTPVPPAPAAVAEAAPVAFSSRRNAAPVVAATGTGASSTAANPGGRIAVLPGDRSASTGMVARLQDSARAATQTLRDKLGALTKSTDKASPAPSQATETPPASVPASGPVSLTATGPGLGGERRRETAAPEAIVASSRPPASEREKASEKEAMTIFGARGNTVSEPTLSGRLLMVGGAVAILLVCVAAWFLYFSGGSDRPVQLAGETGTVTPAPGDTGTETTGTDTTGTIEAPTALAGVIDPVVDPEVAEVPEVAAPEAVASDDTEGSIAAPDPLAEAVAEAVRDANETVAETATAVEEVTETASAAADAVTETDPDRLLEALVAEARNETLPAEALDLTGQTGDTQGQLTAPSAPSDSGTVITQSTPTSVTDSPQLASVSTTSPLRMSLPGGISVPETSEVAFETPAPPPPFGAEFTFDANGLVEATPEGALTPSGVTVFAGRPAATPAQRPAGIAPEPVAAPEPVEPVTPPEALDPEAPRADPALAEFRPRPRSERVRQIGESLTPEPAPEATPETGGADTADPQQDAALIEQPETQTAALDTPPPGGVSLDSLRPQQRPTDLVPPEVLAAVEVAAENPGATPEAVATSPRPSARPSDVTERARAILAAAGSSSPSEDQASETASAAAQPNIPSSASVARQATETNAIRLSEINLIGVFGTADNRRALVRLSSGRRVRVGVGDRLDGGRVTAIGESELHYTRRGRDQVLEIGG